MIIFASLTSLLVGLVLGHAWSASRRNAGETSDQRVIFNSSPALIWYKDRHNRILRINRTAAEAIGCKVTDIEGRQTEEFYPDEAEKYHQDDLEVINTGTPKLGIIEQMRDAQGNKKWVRTDKIPYRNSQGRIIGVIVFALDISDQKQAEDNLRLALATAEKASRAKSEFLANVSHEIRTPLGIIAGFAELVGTAPDAATRGVYLEKILRNCQRLQSLIDGLLDLARVENGRICGEHLCFSLPSLVAEVTSMLALKAREQHLEFSVHMDDAIPNHVIGDPLRVRQILLNIVGNALKFTAVGRVDLEVYALSRSDDAEIIFRVRDTGKGIPQSRIADLFEPFTQADPSDARKYGGSGLGLALSQGLTRSLGGDIVLESSTPGRGSVFRISLPVKIASSSDVPPMDHDIKDETAKRSDQIRILLAEDNPDIQEMIRQYLRVDNASLTVTGDGKSAVDLALKEQPDVVLMDLQLPELSGLEATRELRRLGYARTIVAMTAHATQSQRQVCMNAGFNEFITKPISRDELWSRLKELSHAAIH